LVFLKSFNETKYSEKIFTKNIFLIGIKMEKLVGKVDRDGMSVGCDWFQVSVARQTERAITYHITLEQSQSFRTPPAVVVTLDITGCEYDTGEKNRETGDISGPRAAFVFDVKPTEFYVQIQNPDQKYMRCGFNFMAMGVGFYS